MNAPTRLFAVRCSLLLAAAYCFLIVTAVSAQEDPFGAAPKPAGEAAPTAPAGKKTATRPPPTVEREPLVIELLRATNPTTPEQLLSAAQTALQFGRPDESKKHLEKLLADKPADEALAPLTARFGPFLLQLISEKDVQPAGQQVAELVQSAAQRVSQNPDRIEALVKQLSDPNPAKQQAALTNLNDIGVAVVNPILKALTDPNRASEHAVLRSSLVALAVTSELPLIAALETSLQDLQLQVIAVLGRMQSKRAAIGLIPLALASNSPPQIRQLATAALQKVFGAAPDRYEASKYLRQHVDRYLRADLDIDRNVDDSATLWIWDDAAAAATPLTLSRRDAGVHLAAQAARSLLQLNPADDSIRQQKLLIDLEQLQVMTGLDRSLDEAAMQVIMASHTSVVDLNNVLLEAMRLGRVPAALAAAQALGQSNDAAAVRAIGQSESPLAKALTFPDRRVRLAAASSMIKLAPGEQFPGAGRLGETLAWVAATSGYNSVLIGHPIGEEAQTLVGYVNALGYEGQGTYTGRMLAERAFANPDFSFILISDAIDGPPVEELVQWLRRDYRTARLPIGVMARSERLLRLEQAFADDRFTTVFPRIHSIEVCNSELTKLKTIAGRNFVDRDEKIAAARSALAALETLIKRPAVFAQYDLLRQEPTLIGALGNPALSAQAATILAYFPTASSQQALVDAASQSNRDLAARQAAATAFTTSVQTHGLRIGQPQIAQQYARYNASQTADQPTQELLSALLDTIETPALARGDLTKQP